MTQTIILSIILAMRLLLMVSFGHGHFYEAVEITPINSNFGHALRYTFPECLGCGTILRYRSAYHSLRDALFNRMMDAAMRIKVVPKPRQQRNVI